MNRGIAILVFCALAVAAGCGGGSSLTKAEFIQQGDALCKSSSGELAASYRAYSKEHDLGSKGFSNPQIQEQVIKSVVIPTIDNQVEGLRDLGAPSGDEEEVNAFLDEIESAIHKTDADPSIALGTSSPFAAAEKTAQQYGFKVCGSF